MSKKLFTTVAAGVALVATPVLAQSDMAQRAAAQLQDSERFGGGANDDDENGGGLLMALLAGGLIIAGIVVATSSDEEDLPTSP